MIVGGDSGAAAAFSSSRRADEKKPAVTAGFLEFGRHERIRTSDPRHPMTVRYQAALHADAMKNHTTDSRCLCKRLTT